MELEPYPLLRLESLVDDQGIKVFFVFPQAFLVPLLTRVQVDGVDPERVDFDDSGWPSEGIFGVGILGNDRSDHLDFSLLLNRAGLSAFGPSPSSENGFKLGNFQLLSSSAALALADSPQISSKTEIKCRMEFPACWPL